MLSSMDQIQWRENHVPHRVRAALAITSLLESLQEKHRRPPRYVDQVDQHCEHNAIWEGRIAAVRWLIEFIGISADKSGRPARPTRRPNDIGIEHFDAAYRFDVTVPDATVLARAWLACSQRGSHASIDDPTKPPIDNVERDKALKLVLEHLSATIYKSQPDWLQKLVLVAEQ
jgi:hypothetical protein